MGLMEISPGVEIIRTALWLKREETIIINDLHVGYEEALHHRGVLVPRFQLQDIVKELKLILEQSKPRKVIINGDLKHEFGTILRREWKEVLELLDFLLGFGLEVIIIQGNHDPIIRPLAEKRGIRVVKEYSLGDILIVHGDELVEQRKKVKTIIIGHEHPAIIIKEGAKREKFKCFLKGKWQKKELLVMPSFNPLLEGTDVLKGDLLSPFLRKIDDFEIFVVGEKEVLEFGKAGMLK